MQDVTVLAEQLSESYLAFLREKEDFFEFECDSCWLGFEVIAMAMSRVLSWHAGSRQARERFEAAIAYGTPRFLPAPFDPMVKLRCHANRTHAKPDDLGRNRLRPR